MARYKRDEVRYGAIVHAKLSTQDRLGYITSVPIKPGEIWFRIDGTPTSLDDIDQIVTKEWYEEELLKTFPFLSWTQEHKNKIKSMIEREPFRTQPVPVRKQEKSEWVGVAYPEGYDWTGD